MARRSTVPPEAAVRAVHPGGSCPGRVTRDQLRSTSWRRLGCGFCVWAGLGDSPGTILSAVQRRLRAGAAFAGRTAAWLRGLDLPPCSPIEVAVPEASVEAVRSALAPAPPAGRWGE